MLTGNGLPMVQPIGSVEGTVPVLAAQRTQREAAVAEGFDHNAADSFASIASGPGVSLRGRQAAQAYGGDSVRPAPDKIRRVDELMSTEVFALSADTTLGLALRALEASGHAQAPVLAADGALLGLFVPPLFGFAAGVDTDTPISEVMTTPIEAAALGTDIRAVARLLIAVNLPGLPVTDAAGRVCGFIARADIVAAVGQEPPLDLWI